LGLSSLPDAKSRQKRAISISALAASKAVRLHVSVPSHCPLLQPVADLLGKRMSSVNLTTPRMTYVGNVNARAMRTKEAVARDLINNIAHGVRWHDATTMLKELGCNLFLEMPPGHILSDLAEQNLPSINSVPVEASVLPRVLRLVQMQNANDDASQLIRMKKYNQPRKT
jgi:malonate decarboxylase epsilon subunit